MEEIGKLLGALIAGIIIAAVVIWVFIFIVLPMWMMYLLSRTFCRQVNAYKFVLKTKIVLTLIGLVSIGISALSVISAGVDTWFALIFYVVLSSVTTFLILSVLTLGIWAFAKKAPFIKRKYCLKSKRARVRRKIKRAHRAIETKENDNHKLEQRFGRIIAARQTLKQCLNELCKFDAQSYTVKRREMERRIKKMDKEQKRNLKHDLTRELKKRGKKQEGRAVGEAIQLCLLKMDELNGPTFNPYSSFEANRQEIVNTQRNLSHLQQVKTDMDKKFNVNENNYRNFVASGIVLN